LHFQPFDNPFEKRLKTFIEFCIYLLLTHFLAFHLDEKMAQDLLDCMGLAMVTIVAVKLLLNVYLWVMGLYSELF
jgi:hypothetical protein